MKLTLKERNKILHSDDTLFFHWEHIEKKWRVYKKNYSTKKVRELKESEIKEILEGKI